MFASGAEPLPHDESYQLGADDGLRYRGLLLHIDDLQALYVETAGSGPPIVFIPGYGGDAVLFLNLADELSGDYTVIRFDRRGNSRSRRGWLKVSLAEQAADVARLLDVLGHERAFVVGSSNGCSVALTFMLGHRDRLLHGVLHEPFWSASFVDDPDEMRRSGELGTRTIQLRREKDCGELEARLRYLGGDELVEWFTAESRKRMGENAETGAIERAVFSQWEPTEDEWGRIAELPLTLLKGRDSLAIFGQSVARFERRLGLQAIEVPGGHGGFVDHAPEVAVAVRAALSEAAAGLRHVA
jgi:pimeloyl-ACP methyl ester carboxylesterase